MKVPKEVQRLLVDNFDVVYFALEALLLNIMTQDVNLLRIKELEKLVNKHGSKRHKTIIKLLKSHIASVDPRIYDKVGKLYDEINKILYHRNDR